MIHQAEYACLASAARDIWALGAPREGALVDAGSFIGASTLALAEGLSESPLSEEERKGRIWSYDLFRVIPAMAKKSLKDENLQVGDSFRYLYDDLTKDYRGYIRTFEGDILAQPVPTGDIAILFLDVLWNSETHIILGEKLYPGLVPGQSLLIHQDFVYPYYPWIIIGMGLLKEQFPFHAHIEASTVVFDVKGPYPEQTLNQILNVPLEQALSFYDEFIDKLEGWARGSLGLGKAMYLASEGHQTYARNQFDGVMKAYGNLRRVNQYADNISAYIERSNEGQKHRLGKIASVAAGMPPT